MEQKYYKYLAIVFFTLTLITIGLLLLVLFWPREECPCREDIIPNETLTGRFRLKINSINVTFTDTDNVYVQAPTETRKSLFGPEESAYIFEYSSGRIYSPLEQKCLKVVENSDYPCTPNYYLVLTIGDIEDELGEEWDFDGKCFYSRVYSPSVCVYNAYGMLTAFAESSIPQLAIQYVPSLVVGRWSDSAVPLYIELVS